MNEIDPNVIRTLTEHANEIVAGSYKNVDKVFGLTDKTKNNHDLAELAESFGMMSVKIEAREYALEQKIEELRQKNEQIAALSTIRSILSKTFVGIVLVIALYIFLLGFLYNSNLPDARFIRFFQSYPVIELISLLIIVRVVWTSKLRMQDFGITLKGWRHAVTTSLFVSTGLIALMALVKFLVNRYYPGVFKEKQIIDLSYFGISYITYIVVAPLQEFVSRGAIQGTLEKLLDVRSKGFVSILVTTMLFGAIHMMISFNLALASIIMGWIWGWMYHKQQSLVGVSLSHFLVGNMAGLMGYWNFF